jgi:environmental stress-induced protein Ves
VSEAIAHCERFDLETLPARPWKNGAGLTREIATHPRDAGIDAFDWRVSVAEVTRHAPFSAFPGVDRCIVLLRGAGMRLVSTPSEIDHRLDRPGVPFAFAGEWPIDAQLLDGATSDLNVMTRRGRWRAGVVSLHAPSRVPGAEATLLLCCAGAWSVDATDAQRLLPWQGLLWRAPQGPLAVMPHAAHAAPWLIAISLCHDRVP